ncbi:hypothetical protein D3C72_2089160 [compost metagenome]
MKERACPVVMENIGKTESRKPDRLLTEEDVKQFPRILRALSNDVIVAPERLQPSL